MKVLVVNKYRYYKYKECTKYVFKKLFKRKFWKLKNEWTLHISLNQLKVRTAVEIKQIPNILR